jgi:hypothetical protein
MVERPGHTGFDRLHRDRLVCNVLDRHGSPMYFICLIGNLEKPDTGPGADEPPSARSEKIRGVFNRPFWPFVLATTSVG